MPSHLIVLTTQIGGKKSAAWRGAKGNSIWLVIILHQHYYDDEQLLRHYQIAGTS